MKLTRAFTLGTVLLGGTICWVVAYCARAGDIPTDIPPPSSTWERGGTVAADPADRYVLEGRTRAASTGNEKTGSPAVAVPRTVAPKTAPEEASPATRFPFWTLEPVGAVASLAVLALLVVRYGRRTREKPEAEVYAIEPYRQQNYARRELAVESLLSTAQQSRNRRKAA